MMTFLELRIHRIPQNWCSLVFRSQKRTLQPVCSLLAPLKVYLNLNRLYPEVLKLGVAWVRHIKRMHRKCEQLFSKWSNATSKCTMFTSNISNDSLRSLHQCSQTKPRSFSPKPMLALLSMCLSAPGATLTTEKISPPK